MDKTKKEMKQKWVDFYSGVSLSGFHFIFDSKRFFVKMLWLVIVIAATALAFALFYGSITDYLSYKTNTNWDEALDSTQVEFPTVTICNINSVSETKIEDNSYGLPKKNLIKFYESLHAGKFDENDKNTTEILNVFEQNGITKLEDIFSLYEFDITELIQDPKLLAVAPEPCTFKNIPCNITDFTKVVSIKYGVCYQYNSIHLLKNRLFSHKAGDGGGLRLYLHADEDDLLVSRVPFSGLQVYIHPFGEPFETSYSKRVSISQGKMAFIRISMVKSVLLPHPYPSNCSTKEYSHVHKDIPYSQSMCSVDCVVGTMMDECGCVAVEFVQHLDDKSKVCGVNKLSCIDKFTVAMQEKLHKCRSDCPRQCETLLYRLSTGETSMTSTRNIRELTKRFNMTKEEARDQLQYGMFGIDVIFSDIVYGKESLSPAQNWVTLCGQIGGSLGLALGASAITFVEFVIFGMQMIALYCKEGDKKKKSQPDGNSNNVIENKSTDLKTGGNSI